jgi:hypothetical protein
MAEELDTRKGYSVAQNSHIMMLSADILIHVFHLVRPTTRAHSLLEPDEHTAWGSLHLYALLDIIPSEDHFLAFSQVCCTWRLVAITTLSLWTTPIFHRSKPLAQMMLDRASTAAAFTIIRPLHSMINLRTLITLLTPHFHGLVSLMFEGPQTAIRQALNTIVAHAPNLTKLAFISSESYNQKRLFTVELDHEHALEAPITHSHLTFLRLTGCFVNMHLQSLSSLTGLVIDWDSMIEFVADEWMMVPSILDVLKTCPVLETLQLHNFFYRASGPISREEQRIVLPHLHTLIIHDGAPEIYTLFSSILTPELRRFNLSDYSSSHEFHLIDLLRDLSRYKSTLAGRFRSLSLALAGNILPTICAGSEGLDDRNFSYKIKISTADRREPDRFIAMLVRHWRIQWTEVRELRLGLPVRIPQNDDENMLMSREACAMLLEMMPRLERLHLVGMHTITTTLATLSHLMNEGRPLCSSLTTLVLEEMTFSLIPSDIEQIRQTSSDALESWLIKKLEYSGHVLDLLQIRNCTVIADEDVSESAWRVYYEGRVGDVEFRDCSFQIPKL